MVWGDQHLGRLVRRSGGANLGGRDVHRDTALRPVDAFESGIRADDHKLGGLGHACNAETRVLRTHLGGHIHLTDVAGVDGHAYPGVIGRPHDGINPFCGSRKDRFGSLCLHLEQNGAALGFRSRRRVVDFFGARDQSQRCGKGSENRGCSHNIVLFKNPILPPAHSR